MKLLVLISFNAGRIGGMKGEVLVAEQIEMLGEENLAELLAGGYVKEMSDEAPVSVSEPEQSAPEAPSEVPAHEPKPEGKPKKGKNK